MEIKLDNPKEVKKFMKELGSQKRTMQNDTGNTVIASVLETGELELRTHQDNGWVRVNYFDAEGYDGGETFDGKWK